MDNFFYLKFSFDCVILGFRKDVLLLTLDKSVSPPFFLSDGKVK